VKGTFEGVEIVMESDFVEELLLVGIIAIEKFGFDNSYTGMLQYGILVTRYE
jgi:hypothetical protein